VAHLRYGGTQPIVFIFAGMVVWNLFSGIITRAQGSLVSNRDLVSKVFFPRMLVPLATGCSSFVDFVVSSVFMGVLLVFFGVSPGFAIVLIPVWTVMLMLFASGIGLVAGALQVRYRDVAYVVPFLLQFFMFASPVAYSTEAIPSKYQLIYDLNPLTWILNEFRWSFIAAPAPPPWQIAMSIVVPLVVFVGGAVIFEQMERGFADVI